jgi:hypothetical protein
LDPRYSWNNKLLEEFLAQGISQKWFVSLMQGFIDLKTINSALSIMLIARRRYLRGGVRFFHRGIDDNSNVANFCELEVILLFKEPKRNNGTIEHVYSYS